MDITDLIRETRRPEDEDPRRRQILEAAGRIFYRYGFRKTSLDDIARECRISKKTIYRHFDGKDELVRTVLFELASEKLDSVLWVFGDLVPGELRGLVEEPAAEPSLREMLKALAGFTRRMRQRFSHQMLTDLRTDYPELLEGLYALREPFVRAVVEMLELGQRKGEVRASVNPLVVAEMLFTAFESLLNSPLLLAEGIGPAEISLTFLDVVSHGLLTCPPEEEKA